MNFEINMNSEKTKKERENRLFNRFKSIFEADNKVSFSIVKPGESPDFDFVLDGQHIGLELTEIYQDDLGSLKGSKLKINQKAYVKFTDDVIHKIQAICDIKFTLNIRFASGNRIDKSFKSDYSGILANVCFQFLTLLSNKQFIEIQNTGNMPEQIYSIVVCRYDKLDSPINLTCTGGVLPAMRADIIEKAIRVKEKKLHDYRKMDEQWLLLIEGVGYEGSFSEIDLGFQVKSKFQRVFLYRCFHDIILEVGLYAKN